MDPTRFDHLTRLLGRARGRRAVLGALLAGVLGPAAADVAPRKRDRDKDRGDHRDGRPDRGKDDTLPQAEARGKKRRKKSKKKRGGNGNGSGTPPPPADCCGTESCPDPERGSTSAGCDFAGQSFAGQDLNGSIFRGIDGRGANFNQTDNHGSVFAEACLQGATFRRARLDGSTWGGACLFGADFTGAELDDDDPLFAEALFCDTTLPDGSVNDRDCGRETACCRAELGGGDPCQRAADCPDQPCQTKSCQNGECVYDEVFTGPSPNNLCTFCCFGGCCLAPANQCNTANSCCAPNCAGRVCGPDGCGGTGTCGPGCARGSGQRCNAAGQCVCDAISCPDGCCESLRPLGPLCWPGDTVQRCGEDGEACQTCGASQGCVNQRCRTCTPQCAGRQCGPDGCGGQCGECDGLLCDEETGQCLCTASACPAGCCSNGPGNPGVCRFNQPNTCGTNGARCIPCSPPSACTAQGQCVCTPDCAGNTCGPDGCGGSCGTCPPGEFCGDPFPGQCACDADSCPTGLQCCPAGGTDRCLGEDGGVCSQPGDCCSGNCCGGAVCCSDDQTCCGETCCDSGQFCCNGVCCNQPCCGNACCPPGQPCCSGVCCCGPGIGSDCCQDENGNETCCEFCTEPNQVCCADNTCGIHSGGPCQFPGGFDSECCSNQCDSNSRCT